MDFFRQREQPRQLLQGDEHGEESELLLENEHDDVMDSSDDDDDDTNTSAEQSWHTPPQQEEEEELTPTTTTVMVALPISSTARRKAPSDFTATAALVEEHVEDTSQAAAPPPPRLFSTSWLLFVAAIGSTVSWTAVLSNLVYYTQTFGPAVFLQLNMAVYSPWLPAALAQARWDSYFDLTYNTVQNPWRTFVVRGHIGYMATVMALLALAQLSCSTTTTFGSSSSSLDHLHYHSNYRFRLLALTTVLGAASAILQGSLRQLASVLSHNSAGSGTKLPAAVTAGMQASALLVLGLSLVVNTTASGSNNQQQPTLFEAVEKEWLVGTAAADATIVDGASSSLTAFYRWVAAVVALCWMAFGFFMRQSRDRFKTASSTSRASLEQRAAVNNENNHPPSTTQTQRQRLRRRRSPRVEDPLLLLEDDDDEESGGGGSYTSTNNNNNMETLMSSNENITDAEQEEESTMLLQEEYTSIAVVTDEEQQEELSYTELWKQTWPCCIAVMITVASSMSVASWFNRVESVNPALRDRLPPILFYTRLLADLVGRPATLWLFGTTTLTASSSTTTTTTTTDHDNNNTISPPPQRNNHRRKRLLLAFMGVLTCLRILFVPYFFLTYSSPSSSIAGVTIPRSDWGMIAGVAGFAFSSGFVVTLGYQLAPKLLLLQRQTGRGAEGSPNSSNIHDTANQARLLNVCFSVAVVLGLLASVVLSTVHGA